MPLEQVAVDIGETRQVFVERRRALVLWRIEHLEQLREPRPEIGPVLAGARVDEVEEDVARLEHPGVVGEHAEDDAHKEAFQIVPLVPGIGESIVQPPDQLGGLDVRRVLVAERPALHAEDEAERLDMRGQVRQREGNGLALVQIVKLEGLEVAHQDEARALAVRQRVEILPGLFVRLAEIAPGALLFDDQYARPEQVDEARTVVQLRDMRPRIGRRYAAAHRTRRRRRCRSSASRPSHKPHRATLRRRRPPAREPRSTTGASVRPDRTDGGSLDHARSAPARRPAATRSRRACASS